MCQAVQDWLLWTFQIIWGTTGTNALSLFIQTVYISKQCSMMGVNMWSKTVEAVLVQTGCIVVLQTECSSASRA